MQVVRVHEYGGPEVLRLDDLPTPQPGPGSALVRVRASGVNFIDIYHRIGYYPGNLPVSLGREGAGIVEAVGEGVSEVTPGQRVAWAQVQGSYATHVAVPIKELAPIPDGISDEQAAAAMLQGMTAHYLTRSTYRLEAGSSCLIHAAAGGVGRLLVQMAKLAGASPIVGTVSTEAKARLAREAGADELILYTQQDFVGEVKRITGGRGVDVVYDGVGKDTFDKSLECLRPRGYMVLFGASSGAVPLFEIQRLQHAGSLFLTRPTLHHYVPTRQELLERANEVFSWMQQGKLEVRIDRTYPLADAAQAQTDLASRGTAGKLLLNAAR